MRRNKCVINSARGIILLEVLVAFTILSVSLGVLLQTTGSSIARQHAVAKQMKAISHASNLLAELDFNNISGAEASGEIDDTYSWHASFEPIKKTQGLMGDEETNIALVTVNLKLTWHERGAEKSFQLATKRLAMSHP